MSTELTPESARLFAEAIIDSGRSANTARAYRSDLMSLLRFHETECIKHDDLDVAGRKWLIATRKTSPATTTRRRAATLRAYADEHRLTVLTKYKMPPMHQQEAHPIPEGIDGVRAMLQCAKPREALLLALCGGMGLRVDEAISVRASDIDQHTNTLTVVGKGEKTRVLPVTNMLMTALEGVSVASMSPNKPLVGFSNSHARRIITRLGQDAGLSRPISSHDLRATFATAVYNNSKDLAAVQDLLGHASPDTTRRYTLTRMQAKRSATKGI